MVKELIRNGGFERGNLDFWKVTHGSVNVVSDVKKRGNRAAKFICGAFGVVELDNKDYIEVTPFSLYKFTGWFKNVNLTKMQVLVFFYDSDIQHISGGDLTLWEKSGTYDWTFAEEWFTVPVESSYIALGIAGTGSSGEYGYIDSISLQEADLSKLAVYTRELLSKTNFTSTGTFYSDEYFSGVWKYAEFYLNVTSLTGTDPTLDVTIQAYDPSTGLWKDIAVFEQVTSSDTQLKVATAGLGWKVRVKYTTGGSLTDGDFIVGAVFKR